MHRQPSLSFLNIIIMSCQYLVYYSILLVLRLGLGHTSEMLLMGLFYSF